MRCITSTLVRARQQNERKWMRRRDESLRVCASESAAAGKRPLWENTHFYFCELLVASPLLKLLRGASPLRRPVIQNAAHTHRDMDYFPFLVCLLGRKKKFFSLDARRANFCRRTSVKESAGPDMSKTERCRDNWHIYIYISAESIKRLLCGFAAGSTTCARPSACNNSSYTLLTRAAYQVF